MTSWLSKQRKQTLVELSNEAGLPQNEDSRKDELVENLDAYLARNATRLSKHERFEPYYGTRRTPFKARSSSVPGVTTDDGEVKSVVKARGRRTTKVKQEEHSEEVEADSPSHAVVPTSSAVSGRAPWRPRRWSELPPSPRDVADDVEHATQRMSAGINELYEESGISERLNQLRELCSSVTSVQLSFLFLEAIGLQMELLPWVSLLDFGIPSTRLLGISTPSIPLMYPDFFRLLTSIFWSSSTVWSLTSIFIPLAFAYVYNLSTRDVKRHGSRVTVTRHRFDPLTFNVVKGIVTHIVYSQGYTFGLFDRSVSLHIGDAMFGGYRGMLVGSYVGGLAALYEAAQRK